MANEKRLIDANALMKAIKSFRWFGVPNTLQLMFDYLKIIIRDQPTVDAMEVVRCKDCEHWSVDQYGCVCKLHSEKENTDYPAFEVQMLPTDFCSYGERKDNARKTD